MRRPSHLVSILAGSLAVSLAAFALASCDDAGDVADTDGGPFSNIHTDGGGNSAGSGPKDAGAGGSAGTGPADAKVDGAGTGGAGGAKDAGTDAPADGPKGSGGAGAMPGSGGTTGGGGAGGGTTGAQTCSECEAANCNKGTTKTAYAGCFNALDDQGNPAKAAGGPAMGMLKSDLCNAVLKCVRSNNCEVQCDPNGLLGKDAQGNPLPDGPACNDPMSATGDPLGVGDIFPGCYCGLSTDQTMCGMATGYQNGPCKDAYENAAEVSSPSTAPSEVSMALSDPANTLGAAARLLERCDWGVCRGPCYGLPALPGSGGSTSGAAGAGGMPGASGSGGTTGAGGGGAGGGAPSGDTLTYYQCTACEAMQSGGCTVPLRNCSTATGTAAAGPATGMNKSELCMAVVTCARRTGCAQPDGDISLCYCGPDRANQENGDCFTKGLGTGACRAEIEAASETTTPSDISMRLSNPDPSMPEPQVMGFAATLVACDIAKCNDPCSQGDPPGYTPPGSGGAGPGGSAGSGGMAASGGVTGSGGDSGSGGVTASGGATASGGVTGSGGITASGGITGSGGVVGGGGNSLVVNPDFATSGSAWSPDFSMLASWTASKDGNGDAASGALLVTNVVVADVDGTTIGGARQCVPVQGGIALTLSTQVFIPGGQNSSGSAGVELDFYPTGDCTGPVSGQYTSALISDTDTWRTIAGGTATPVNAQTMAVRLVISKTFRNMALDATFDNVLVKGP